MSKPVPVVLVPGLACSPLLFAPQFSALWEFGPVMVADNRRGTTMAQIAAHILDAAPARFALAGLSMGGYIAFEIMRRAPERVLRLALLDTAAVPESPEQTERRDAQIAMARSGQFSQIPDLMLPRLMHPQHQKVEGLVRINRQMHESCGPEAYIRQQEAIKARADSRPHLSKIRCPTLVLVGDSDQLTPPDNAREIAAGIRGAKLVEVETCGHLSTLEQPRAVSRALVDWMGG
nr:MULTISPECIES: alpha/beta fold hydrolase [Rhodomicrobium]